jgi:SNF2 family DNA or RNA helicase
MFLDQKNNILIYENAPQVIGKIPDARQLSNGYVAFPRTLFNCQMARWLGLPSPPIMDGYDWPIIADRKPLKHQILTSNFMVLHQKCLNLSDMGTMKTLSTLWAADWLMTKFPGTCSLIVCPRSITQRVWGDEIFSNFGGRRKFVILDGPPKKRLEKLNKPHDFYIINYDGLKVGAHRRRRGWEFDSLAKAILERKDLQVVIIDEADAFKDGRTDRSRVARHLLLDRAYVWLLTGTPTPQAPSDAHGLALFINNAGGESYYSFFRRTMVQVSQWKWLPSRDGYEQARKLLQPAIRVAIRDVWDGPERTVQQRSIKLTAEQIRLLKDLKYRLKVETKKGAAIIPANEAVSRTKALQIILGAIYDHDHIAHEVDARDRLEETLRVIEQSVGKVLCFVGLTSIVELLHQWLAARGISVSKVIGLTTDKERAEIFGAFQEKDAPRVLVADPGTMAHGLNLYAATTVLWYGPTDRSGLYVQGNARAHRPGQKHPVTVVQLAATALERAIFRRLEQNISLQGAMLDWVKGGEL